LTCDGGDDKHCLSCSDNDNRVIQSNNSCLCKSGFYENKVATCPGLFTLLLSDKPATTLAKHVTRLMHVNHVAQATLEYLEVEILAFVLLVTMIPG